MRAARRGDREAYERVVATSQALVLHIATSIREQLMPPRPSLADLFQEGAVGLVKAAQRYDPRKRSSFATYAAWWIRNEIQHATHRERPVLLPRNLGWLALRWKRRVEQLRDAFDAPGFVGELTLDQVAERLGVPSGKRRLTFTRAVRAVSVRRVCLGAAIFHRPCQRFAPEARALEADGAEVLARALTTLDHRSRKILRMRYGLDGRSPMTLEQVAGRMTLSRERVRQIENNALWKLRKVMATEGEEKCQGTTES